MTIAQTILSQLGGNKFRAMTGAKDFVSNANALEFKFPKARARSGNFCTIVLTRDDLYTMTFYAFDRKACTVDPLKSYEALQADKLREVFTAQTGLATSL